MAAFLIFILAAFGAEIVATIAGFGSSTILLPIAALFFEIKVAIGLVGLFHFFGEATDSFLWRKNIVWRIVFLFSVLGVFSSFLGAALVAYLPSRTLLLLLGIFLVFYSIFSLSGRKIFLPKNDLAVAAAGGLVGFLAGLVGTAGALRTAFLSSFRLSKEEFIGTSSAIAIFVDVTRVAVYLGSGTLAVNPAWWVAILGVALVGSWVGRKVALRIPEKTFYKLVYGMLLLAGIKFILG